MMINFVHNILNGDFGLNTMVVCIKCELAVSKELYLPWAPHTVTYSLFPGWLS